MPDAFFYALIFAVAYFIVWYFKRLRTAHITEGMTPKEKAQYDMSICYDSTHSGDSCKSCEDVEKHYRSKGWKAPQVKQHCDTINHEVGILSGSRPNRRSGNSLLNTFEEGVQQFDPNTAVQQVVDLYSLGQNMVNRKDLEKCHPRLVGGTFQNVDSKTNIYKTQERANLLANTLNDKLGTSINRPSDGNGMCYKVTDNFEISEDCTPSMFVEYVHPSNDNDNTLRNMVDQSLDGKLYYKDYTNIIEDNKNDFKDGVPEDAQKLKSFMEATNKQGDPFSMYYKYKKNKDGVISDKDTHGFIRLEHMKCCTGSRCGTGGAAGRALQEGFTQGFTQDDEDSGCCSTDCEAIPHATIYNDQEMQKKYAYICKYKDVEGFSSRVKKMCNWWNKLKAGCQVDENEETKYPKPYIAQMIDQWRCEPGLQFLATDLYDKHKGDNDISFQSIRDRGGDLCKP